MQGIPITATHSRVDRQREMPRDTIHPQPDNPLFFTSHRDDYTVSAENRQQKRMPGIY